MRLTCPNCNAQYEVDDGVIPEAGRDVQCSNCGHAWFQESAAALAAREQEAEEAAADEEWTAPPPVEAEPEAPEEAPDEVEIPADITGAEPPRKRRTLDDAVMTVLREEAEREARARKAEGATLETQTELALQPEAAPPPKPQEDRVAHVGDDPEEDDARADVARTARRELLPDIEEINSTLRATSERGGEAAAYDAPETLRRNRSGFRLGFASSFVIAVLLLATYVLSPMLAEKFPAAAPFLNAYVAGAESLRAWLDSVLRATTEAIRGDGG